VASNDEIDGERWDTCFAGQSFVSARTTVF
jgi:hypothetical protein